MRVNTVPGTATAAVDFIMRSGTLSIPAGSTSGFIDVAVVGDTVFEPDETFEVRLSNSVGATIADGLASGRIVNDDAIAELAIDDTSILEGDYATQLASFILRLNAASPVDVFADYMTIGGTATEGSDFTRTAGTIRIPAGITSASIKVPIVGNARDENNENFSVRLPNVRGASLGRATAIGTILNDDRYMTVFREREGNWYERNIATGAMRVTQWGLPGDVPVPADYNGDGTQDIAVWRPSNGTWYVKQSGGGVKVVQWGLTDDIPQVGDFNGDGVFDFMVFRPSNQTWWLRDGRSDRVMLAGAKFGTIGDLPVVADFDGNGSTDIAVYRRSNGTYWAMDAVRFGQLGWITWGQIPSSMRSGREVFIAADFDGDRKIDIGTWNDVNGTWNVLQSESRSWITRQFGLSGDSPQIMDYDNDGRADFTVWRPLTGIWYSQSSASSKIRSQQWGWLGDIATNDKSNHARKRLWGW